MNDQNLNATEVNTEASAEQTTAPKAPKAITTAKHARFLAEAARKRASKLREAVVDADNAAADYEAMALILPEGAPAAVKGRAPIEVGTEVTFRFGRTTATSAAVVLTGIVKARKDDADGKPEAYRIAVGTGFDEELRTVQPGAIISVAGVAEPEDEQTDEQGASPAYFS